VFLKSLTLKGFKSFADSTTLEFEPGVTAVVGPNGSGKSNVVDAVAWVLGAQGPRTVRSAKMEDVIFAGTSSRPALGRAEVSLTIDNSAGLLPIELTEVTITRTLFRSGESEYALNGVPCRLLDIQELLSDSGVGRQQHVIVSQGQLDSVLNARPEDRRLVIEEAAGVLKYRRRRERAQRRLESTEANLTRLNDLLREVRRQLRPLEKQAEAARRHAELAGHVRDLRLHVAGREVASLEHRLAAAADSRRLLATNEVEVKQRLAGLDAEVRQAEDAVSASAANDDLADTLGRLESARQRARGLTALLAERRRSLERDLAASRDEGVVASLEADAAALTTQLAEVDRGASSLAEEVGRVEEAELKVERERDAFTARWGGDEEAPDSSAAELRATVAGRRSALERDRAEMSRLAARRTALAERKARLGAEVARLEQELAVASGSAEELARSVEEATSARAAAEAAAERAEAESRAAERSSHSWSARAEALALALDEAAARAGAARLAGMDGIVGTLLDLVEVDPGWEAAFEAALGDAVAAVVVDGPPAARAAVARLHEQDARGALLPLGLRRPDGEGSTGRAVPSGAELVRSHVRSSHPGVGELLDALLGGVVVAATWSDAVGLATDAPAVVAVTREGHRFGPRGWRTGAAGPGATGAALEEARRRAGEAAADAARSAEALTAARARLSQARQDEDVATRAAAERGSTAARNRSELASLTAQRAELEAEDESLARQLGEAEARAAEEERSLADLEARLPELEEAERVQTERAAERREARRRLDELVVAAAALRSDLEVRAAGLEERRSVLSQRLAEVEERLRSNVAERERAAARRVAIERSLAAVERLAETVSGHSAVLEELIADVRDRRRRQAEDTRAAAAHLDGLRRSRSEAERTLEQIRDRVQKGALEEAEARMRLEAVVETIRRDLDCEPDAAKAAPRPEMPDGASPEARLRDLERELRLLGPINPLALEEYAALEERHGFLEGQLEDVKSSRRELAKVIRAVDTEIVEVFAAAYADVSANFSDLFSTLFPGGSGQLRLTDPENLLETGVEIEGRPSGKNVRRLSLLSGGERSLTAIAFLFAVFRSRPSPFYLMDEVEAALDDVNLHRFIDLVREFRDEAQLLIVTHQKRTMEAADCLYGVTMQPGGSSRVISEKVAAGA